MAIGLKDIAEDLNCSVSLVSKVLNGRSRSPVASKELTQAIKDRARELGYRRNRTAAALTSGHHGAIGVFIHRLGATASGVPERLIKGIAEGAAVHDQRLWLNFFKHDEDFLRYRDSLHAGEIDGLIICGAVHPAIIADLLECERRHVPVVTVHPRSVDPGLITIRVDQELLMAMATRHLLKTGSHRLAHIATKEARTRGFIQAHEEFNLQHDPNLFYHTDTYEYEDGQKAAHAFLNSGIEFDGVVAQSDQQAFGVMHVLLKHGLKVPEDVQVIGVDNCPAAESSIIKLSSVSENYTQQGHLAVETLMARIDGKSFQPKTILPTLHLRESTR